MFNIQNFYCLVTCGVVAERLVLSSVDFKSGRILQYLFWKLLRVVDSCVFVCLCTLWCGVTQNKCLNCNISLLFFRQFTGESVSDTSTASSVAVISPPSKRRKTSPFRLIPYLLSKGIPFDEEARKLWRPLHPVCVKEDFISQSWYCPYSCNFKRKSQESIWKHIQKCHWSLH